MLKKVLKAGILLSILVIPASVFIFLNVFGDNKFDLPYFFPELDETGHVKVMGTDTVFHQVPDFRLANAEGDTLALTDLDQSYKAVSFFFSRCGTICPVLNSNLSRIADSFKGNKEVRFLSITVDPEYDTPVHLLDYKKEQGFDQENWNFLTGNKAYIYDLAIKGFKLPVADASVYNPNVVDIDEQFIHSEKVLLLDKENFIRGIYDGTNKDDIERLRLEIKVLLDETKNK